MVGVGQHSSWRFLHISSFSTRKCHDNTDEGRGRHTCESLDIVTPRRIRSPERDSIGDKVSTIHIRSSVFPINDHTATFDSNKHRCSRTNRGEVARCCGTVMVVQVEDATVVASLEPGTDYGEGSRLGQYELRSIIGRGVSSFVYMANNLETGQNVVSSFFSNDGPLVDFFPPRPSNMRARLNRSDVFPGPRPDSQVMILWNAFAMRFKF